MSLKRVKQTVAQNPYKTLSIMVAAPLIVGFVAYVLPNASLAGANKEKLVEMCSKIDKNIDHDVEQDITLTEHAKEIEMWKNRFDDQNSRILENQKMILEKLDGR